MSVFRVNADYEKELFGQLPSSDLMNRSLEFVFFFVGDGHLCSSKKYDQNYCEYVQEVTGQLPQMAESKEPLNWWGELSNIKLEQQLNSKVTSAPWTKAQVIDDFSQLHLKSDQTYLVKVPIGMSGSEMFTFTTQDLSKFSKSLEKNKILIVEPLLNRKFDFSTYVFPDGALIDYQNFIDHKFQYRGTLFINHDAPEFKNFQFYPQVIKEQWDEYIQLRQKIIKYYRDLGAIHGFSIDSFIYLDGGELKVKSISEVNYRKTMGLVCWLLAKRYAYNYPWALLIIGKKKIQKNFSELRRDLNALSKYVLILSPGDTRFELFFVMASDSDEGKKIFNQIKILVPYIDFSVEL